MLKLSSLLSFILLTSCIPGPLPCNNWRMVRQTVTTTDHAGTQTSEKTKDFSVMDSLHFLSSSSLSLVSFGEATKYSYQIKDSILTYWPADNEQKKIIFKILTATKDSLVLRGSETWGSQSPVKITATFHLAAIK